MGTPCRATAMVGVITGTNSKPKPNSSLLRRICVVPNWADMARVFELIKRKVLARYFCNYVHYGRGNNRRGCRPRRFIKTLKMHESRRLRGWVFCEIITSGWFYRSDVRRFHFSELIPACVRFRVRTGGSRLIAFRFNPVRNSVQLKISQTRTGGENYRMSNLREKGHFARTEREPGNGTGNRAKWQLFCEDHPLARRDCFREAPGRGLREK